MKILRSLSILASLAVLVTVISCGDEDPIDETEEDLEAPVVTISAPTDGKVISTLDETTTVSIKFTATDDVELASVVVDLDGTQLEEVTTFTDFRSYTGNVDKTDVADGEYTITVTATDLAGKTGSATSTFTKETLNPYTPMDGEVLYMPFEGNYTDLVNEADATVVGSPEFAGEGKEGDDAYKGATDSYLTFPTEGIQSTEMTVSVYMKINADPDRAGILIMAPEDPANEEFQNNLKHGFRIFREATNAGATQRIKAHFGNGAEEAFSVWLDGGALADLDPTVDEWHHFALVIGETTAAFYIDGGKVAENAEHTGMDVTGCDLLSIMSGVPRFTQWDHNSDLSSLDELRIFNKALTEAELETLTGLEFGDPAIEDPDDPMLDPIDGEDATEVLYMSFDTDFSVTGAELSVTQVGTPSVVDGGVSGKAYSGDVDSYLTIPTEGLLGDQFSASVWIKLDPTATRAGILTVSAVHGEDPALNNLTKGFRFFREGGDVTQTFKMNVGTGEADAWVDGGGFATFDAAREDWLHLAVTVGGGKSQVYLNGILAAVSSEELVVDWTGCDLMSIGSGAPRFAEWNHLGETSMLDELRIFSGILTPAQIADLKAAGN
ncbi:MAG: LamG-like jellyroll fold domain-containing protein [Marinoscillum sp.]